MSEEKIGQLILTGTQPAQFIEAPSSNTERLDAPGIEQLQQVANAIKEYLRRSKELAEGKYQSVAASIPEHLKKPGQVLVVFCKTGVAIRYDRSTPNSELKILVAGTTEGLEDVVLSLSQTLIQCFSSEEERDQAPVKGLDFSLSVVPAAGGDTRTLYAGKIGLLALLSGTDVESCSNYKPFCAFSVRNSFELELHGEMNSGQAQSQQINRSFVTRSQMQLPVGWACIEAFPKFDIDQWHPDMAARWAEADVQACVIADQIREAEFRSLDPLADARDKMCRVLREFRALLNSSDVKEEVLHQFLNSNPHLLSPTHIKKWSKLPLGKHVTDFVFVNANMEYLLVELESSAKQLFVKTGHLSADANEAVGQITDWKRYLEDNLRTVQSELGLQGITANPNALVVIGRSSDLNEEQRRKLHAVQSQNPTLRIVTYDDVYKDAQAVLENLFGPLIVEGSIATRIYYRQQVD